MTDIGFGAALNPALVDPGLDSRAVTFENPTGARGSGGTAAGGRKGTPSRVVGAGERAVLADLEGPGTLRHFWATVMPQPPEILRAFTLEFFYDGASEPSVSVPMLDFFGLPHGRPVAFESAMHCCQESIPWKEPCSRTAEGGEARSATGCGCGFPGCGSSRGRPDDLDLLLPLPVRRIRPGWGRIEEVDVGDPRRCRRKRDGRAGPGDCRLVNDAQRSGLRLRPSPRPTTVNPRQLHRVPGSYKEADRSGAAVVRDLEGRSDGTFFAGRCRGQRRRRRWRRT
jgi:hypothetical protein